MTVSNDRCASVHYREAKKEEYSVKRYVMYRSAVRKNYTTTFETLTGCGRTRILPWWLYCPVRVTAFDEDRTIDYALLRQDAVAFGCVVGGKVEGGQFKYCAWGVNWWFRVPSKCYVVVVFSAPKESHAPVWNMKRSSQRSLHINYNDHHNVHYK